MHDMSAHDILPANASGLERAVVAALLERIAELDPDLDTLWNPMTCPAALLPYLAWALSADEWDPGWPDETQRRYLAQWPQVVHKKGTFLAVRRALVAAGYGAAELIERHAWDFHDGAASHDGAITYVAPDHWAEYRIRLTRPITLEQAAQVRAILATAAPAHCRLKALDYSQALNLYNARIRHDGRYSHGVA